LRRWRAVIHRSDSKTDFLDRERLASFGVTRADCEAMTTSVEPRELPMTIVGPLSVVAAYASIFFVGAIVLGMF
jgi:hypothetical protein